MFLCIVLQSHQAFQARGGCGSGVLGLATPLQWVHCGLLLAMAEDQAECCVWGIEHDMDDRAQAVALDKSN